MEKLKEYAFCIATLKKPNNKSDIFLPSFEIVYEKRVFDKTAYHFVNYTESRDFLKLINMKMRNITF